MCGGVSSREISDISMNLRSRVFFATFVGRTDAGLYGPGPTRPDPTGVTEGVLVRDRPVDHWEIMELVCATNVPTNARSCRPVCEVVHPNVTRVGGRGGAGTVDVPGGAAVGNVSINSRVGEALGRGKLLARVSQVWPSR